MFIEDSDILSPGTAAVRTVHDPTALTGGMLSEAERHLRAHNSAASLTLFGQELNDEAYAICKADMLIKGEDVRTIIPGKRGPSTRWLRAGLHDFLDGLGGKADRPRSLRPPSCSPGPVPVTGSFVV